MGLALSALYLLATTAGGALLLSLLPVPWTLFERVAYGFFVGLLLPLLSALGLAIVFGFGWPDFWLPCVLQLAATALLNGPRLRALSWSDVQLRLRPQPSWFWPLLTLGPWLVYFTAFFRHAFVSESDGLYAGHVLIWGDWALHLSYASSFLYGQNFPPDFPVLAHQHYEYHFMPDFLAAGFAANGLALTAALAFGSWAAVNVFLAVFQAAATRLAGHPAAGFLAPTIFLLGGGLGFVHLFSDLDHALAQPGGLASFRPHDYTHMPDLNYQWLTPVFGYLIPQRSMAFGLSIALITLVLLRAGMALQSTRLMVFAGSLLGLSPLFHLHATVATGTLAGLIAILHAPFGERTELRSYALRWAAFAVPLAALALPVIAWMAPTGGTGLEIRPRLGWFAYENTREGFVWFWLKNLGPFVPLAIVAQVTAVRLNHALGLLVLPFWSMFLVPNVLILQPWDWDNTKWFLIWMLGLSILVAAFLTWLGRRSREGLALVAGLLVLMCLSATADVIKNLPYEPNRVRFATNEDLRVAEWARAHTPPRSLFLTAETHNHPIPTLAGRHIVIGYPGWLWVFTLPYVPVDSEARTVYSGGPGAEEIIQRERIDYVVIGPEERSASGMSANQAYFDEHYTAVYSSSEYRIYRVR